MNTPSHHLPQGTLLEERWLVGQKLGQGGFATVYEGVHVKIGRAVAIKVLDIQAVPEVMEVVEERFLREAKIAATLNHPNIVQVLDFGVLIHQGLKKPFLVMERLDGHDLEEELRLHGALQATRAKPLFLGALDALEKCHAQGIVHRDLKPSNLYLVNPGQPHERLVVLDFGIAKAFEDSDASLTASKHFTGTPAYLSPEYITNQTVSPALDVYQMGLILGEALIGRPVIQANSPLSYLMAHCNGEHNMPQRFVQTPLGKVVRQSIAVDASARPADAGALAAILAQTAWENLPDVWESPHEPAAPITTTQEGVNPWAKTASEQDSAPLAPSLMNVAAKAPPEHLTPTAETQAPSGQKPVKWVLIFGGLALLTLLVTTTILLTLVLSDQPQNQDTQAPTKTSQPSTVAAKSPNTPATQPPPKPTPQSATNTPATSVAIKPPVKREPKSNSPDSKKRRKPIAAPTKHDEPFHLLDHMPTDSKMRIAHDAFRTVGSQVDRSYWSFKALIESLGAKEPNSVKGNFSNTSRHHFSAVKNLQHLSKTKPVSPELDAAAIALAPTLQELGTFAKENYALRADSSKTLTHEKLAEIQKKWDALMKRFVPQRRAFALAMAEQDQAVMQNLLAKTSPKTSPLMHHFFSSLVLMAKIMVKIEKTRNAGNTAALASSIQKHATAISKADIHTRYKEEASSGARNTIVAVSKIAGRTGSSLPALEKALASSSAESPRDMMTLVSSQSHFFNLYTHAMKSFYKRRY